MQHLRLLSYSWHSCYLKIWNRKSEKYVIILCNNLLYRERYRDLILAADTIEEMKLTTSSTLSHIKNMMVACKSLHNTHLTGFKIESHPPER